MVAQSPGSGGKAAKDPFGPPPHSGTQRGRAGVILGFGSWTLDFDWLEWKDHHPNTGPRRTARDGRGGGEKPLLPTS